MFVYGGPTAHQCLHLWGKCRSCHLEEGGTYGDEDLSDSDEDDDEDTESEC